MLYGHFFLRNQTPQSAVSASSDGSGKRNWISLSVEHACVHALACAFSVPELTKSLDTVPPTGEVISIDDRPVEGVVGMGDGMGSGKGTDDGDVDICVCLERNGVVSLSVCKPL